MAEKEPSLNERILNIAVIGSGYWGPNLIRNVAQLPGANLHTVCDLDEKRLQHAAREFKPQHTTRQVAEVLDNREVDGVIVATPADTHAAIVQQVLDAGKHVMVEKPLALSSIDCQDLIDLAARQDRILMVGHVFEYNPAVTRLKQIVDSGDLGRIFYIYSTRVNLGQIRGDLNAFWNLAPHDISIVNMLMGQAPYQVSGRGFSYLRPGDNLEDVVFAVLEYPSGVTAHIHTSWLDPNKVRRMTIVGEKKMVVYDDISDNRLTIYDKGAYWIDDSSNYGVHRLMTFTGDIHIPKLSVAEPLRLEIEHFLACICTGKRPLSDGVDGLNVVRVLEGVSTSIKNGGTPVRL
jgi:predicted dehydrogenase